MARPARAATHTVGSSSAAARYISALLALYRRCWEATLSTPTREELEEDGIVKHGGLLSPFSIAQDAPLTKNMRLRFMIDEATIRRRSTC